MLTPPPTEPTEHATPGKHWHSSAPRPSASGGWYRPTYKRRAGGRPAVALAVLGVLAVVAGALMVSGAALWPHGFWPAGWTRGAPTVVEPNPPVASASGVAPAHAMGGGGCTAGSRNAFGESVTIAADEHICGDASVYGGHITVLGEVDGNVTAVGGDATIDGQVAGDVRAVGGSVYLQDDARVLGSVRAVGGEVVRERRAFVGGTIQRETVRHDVVPLSWFGMGDGYAFPWLSLIFWLLAALCVAHFFPEPLGRVRSIVRRDFGRSLAMGALTAVAGAVLSVVLIATCLGIPVALVVLGALWLAWVVGTVALGLLVGDRLLGGLAPGGQAPAPAPAAMLGVALLALAESIPCVGGVIALVVGCAGVGAATLAVLHARRASYRGTRIAYR